MVCFKCGDIEENLMADDIIEEEYYGDKIISTVVGHCVDCGAKYIWDEVYVYSHAEDCIPIED